MGAHSRFPVQVVDGEGRRNPTAVGRFFETTTISNWDLSYAVVAVMGPQSSGKSTLLNHLFGTNFEEMNATRGRSQTTRGIWLSQAADISPCTFVFDLEGADSYERGEEDTAFEKKSSVFALEVADVVLINMWCNDIGREQAGSWPLLKLVFQAMMMLFSKEKTTLLFVIRDKTSTPIDKLEATINAGVQKVWKAVVKLDHHGNKTLRDFFDVKVIALSHYEYRNAEFREDVQTLRQLFQDSRSSGGISGNRRKLVFAGDFAAHTQEIWSIIDEKVLDPPALKIMVAEVKCKELAGIILKELRQSKEFLALTSDANVGIVTEFGSQADNLVNNFISRYRNEAAMFDEAIQNKESERLQSRLGEELHGAYLKTLNHHKAAALKMFVNSVQYILEKDPMQMVFCLTTKQMMSIFEKNVEQVMSLFDNGAADAKVSVMAWDDDVAIREKLKTEIDGEMERSQPEVIFTCRGTQLKVAGAGVGTAALAAATLAAEVARRLH